MADQERKTALIDQLAAARTRVTDHAHELHRELDFGARARKSFKRNPLPWVGGASVAGLLLSRLFRRPKVVVPKRSSKAAVVEEAGKAGLAFGALKIAFDLARPALSKWLAHRVSEYVTNRGGKNRFPE